MGFRPFYEGDCFRSIRMIIDRVISVIPAQAGIQTGVISVNVDPRLRA